MDRKNIAVSALMGSMLVVSAVPAVAMANSAEAPAADAAIGVEQGIASRFVAIENVAGAFSWNQDVSATNDQLRKNIYRASDALCVPSAQAGTIDAITSIAVGGEVGNAFAANVADYAKKAPAQKILGCTCLGNPVDGRATANAEVEGFRLAQLVEDAQVAEGVNTITFIAADGYRVSMPLSYVMQRYSIIVSVVNGEELSDAVGCYNQLWLGNTSARAYVQNIVAIEFSTQDVVPAAPGKPGADAPNIGVMSGEVA